MTLPLKKPNLLLSHLAILVTTFTLVGCSSNSPMIPIEGTVTIDGEPLTTGQVVYLPKQQGVGRQAIGPIASDGSFTMTSTKQGDGVMPGEYDIIVLVYEEREKSADNSAASRLKAESSRPSTKSLIPKAYEAPETSGLSDMVDNNHPGLKTIELSSSI